MMREWLSAVLASGRDLSEEAEGYLLGRGMMSETIAELEVSVWQEPDEPAPDPLFRERYKDNPLHGMLCTPVCTPRGQLIGFEGRRMDRKDVTRYLLPEAAWNPVFLGMPKAMQPIWNGGNVWIVEGLFDMAALLRIVPETDAVLATVRAKLTDKHVEFLRRHCRGLVNMVYDNDDTGRRMTFGYIHEKTGKRRWGALDVLQRVGLPCRAVPYQGGKDPGEIWEKYGTPGLERAFAHVL